MFHGVQLTDSGRWGKKAWLTSTGGSKGPSATTGIDCPSKVAFSLGTTTELPWPRPISYNITTGLSSLCANQLVETSDACGRCVRNTQHLGRRLMRESSGVTGATASIERRVCFRPRKSLLGLAVTLLAARNEPWEGQDQWPIAFSLPLFLSPPVPTSKSK